MFWQDFDLGYYQNPATYTYLVYGLLRVMHGPLGFVFDLPFANVTEQFAKDPAQIWIAARTLAALLCMAGVPRPTGRRRPGGQGRPRWRRRCSPSRSSPSHIRASP